MNLYEKLLRDQLGIPDSAQYVLILDQAAHMDWDWVDTFKEYFDSTSTGGTNGSGAGVDVLLTEAFQLLGKSAPRTNPYYYSICEMVFFRKFVSTQIEQGRNIDIVKQIRALSEFPNKFLHIVGGGITSPDCLLTAGESFLRNYLLGKLWLAELAPKLLPLRHCWLPDDFGQDPELPVAVKAMGMRSISFSRLPGITPSPGVNDKRLEDKFLKEGADFYWMASDNASEVFTHWMTGSVPGYFQGGSLFSSGGDQGNIVSATQDFLGYNNVDLTTYTPPFSAAPSNYVYLPLDEDFMYPIVDLLAYVATWNGSGQTNGVYGVAASYDDFVSLVLSTGAVLKTVRYNGTPYWTGFYASRPELKIKHYLTTRLMLLAEATGLLASGNFIPGGQPTTLGKPYWDLVSHAWHTLAPSTHHDYICGTANDDVTSGEQIPVLDTACEEAGNAVKESLNVLLGAIDAPDGDVAIVNGSGIFFDGVVELPAPVPAGMNSIDFPDSPNAPLQITAEGGLVFRAPISSLCYYPASFSTVSVSGRSTAVISPTTSGADSYTLTNEFLTVTVSAAANWGIESISDSSGSLLKDQAIGNDLVFYYDLGNIYQFGNEIPTTFDPVQKPVVKTSGGDLGATVLEQGPVRVRLQTVTSISVDPLGRNAQNYTREYRLVAGEPFLRMITTGAAPSYYSVMAAFPLAQEVDSIVYGTPCHWTARQPHVFWDPPIFRPTHHFVLPHAKETMLAPIYHCDVPAWGFDQNGVLRLPVAQHSLWRAWGQRIRFRYSHTSVRIALTRGVGRARYRATARGSDALRLACHRQDYPV